MRICFDLDETLCTGKPYKNAKPILANINFLKELKKEGHIIIIYTARGMGRSSSNAGAALKEIGALTFLQLDNWGIPYDELFFGKPSADIYIDDKAFNALDMDLKSLGERICQINQGMTS